MEKKRFRPVRSLLALLLCVTLVLCACAPAKEPGIPANAEKPDKAECARSFTDSCGRTVPVPEEINKAAVTGPLAQMVLFAFAPERLAAFADDSVKKAEYISHDYDDLPVIGSIDKDTFSLEELLLSSPDIVIDIGEDRESTAEKMDELTKLTGIPFIHLSITFSDPSDCFDALGELLHLSERGKTYGTFCRSIYSETVSAAQEHKEERSVLYLTGTGRLSVSAKGSYHSAVVDLLSRNAAELPFSAGAGTGSEVDPEGILLMEPDILLADDPGFAEKAAGSAIWEKLPAVQTGNVYRVPSEPFCWFGKPPSVQRYLGLLYLSVLLYGTNEEGGPYENAAEFFAMFFHYDLKREEFDRITDGIFR